LLIMLNLYLLPYEIVISSVFDQGNRPEVTPDVLSADYVL